MISKAGLIGVYQPPASNNKHVNSIYMITDESTNSLMIFILFPGSYDDIYEIASKLWYRTIFLIPVSLTSLYLSDVVRLSEDLTAISKDVKIIHPDKFPAYVPVNTQKNFLKCKDNTAFTYSNGFIAYDYKFDSTTYQYGFHDIFFTFDSRRCLLCPFEVNVERIYKMLSETLVDYIYVPYTDTYFGSESYLTLIKKPEFSEYQNRLVAFGFHSQEEANFCRLHYPYSYPRTYRYAFINSDDMDEGCNKVVIGSSGLQTAVNKFILEKQDKDEDLPIVNEDAIDCSCDCCHNEVSVPMPEKPEKPFVKLELPKKPKPFTIPEIPGGEILIPDKEPVIPEEPTDPENGNENTPDSGVDTPIIDESEDNTNTDGESNDENTI